LRISIVYKKGAGAEARSIKNKAVDAGLEVTGVYGLDEFSQREEDVVVVVGGDGSFLRVAKETDTPIALVRYMSFGFFHAVALVMWKSSSAPCVRERLAASSSVP